MWLSIRFYQTIDTLILDDVQELSGKGATQNTFFHIFNHLQRNNKQIILSADRPPIAIQDLEDRLLTRFKWGMQAEIEKPTQNLRLNILSAKVEKEGLNIPANVLKFISENIDDSVRDLEGVINSLMAYWRPASPIWSDEFSLSDASWTFPAFELDRDGGSITVPSLSQVPAFLPLYNPNTILRSCSDRCQLLP